MATLLVDGHYLLHRTMHVPQLRILSTKDGKPTGGAFGLLKSLRSTLFEHSEISRVAFVFDSGRSPRRTKLYPEYKANRKRIEEVDPDGIPYYKKFDMQRNYLRFVLPRMGVNVVEIPGKEGDDVVGLLARELDDHLRIVSSDDKDMYQLVDEQVHVWRPLAEVRVTLQNFEEVAGCSKENWLLKKAVLGDGSDNIKGIHGVGSKTVDKVLEVAEDIGEYPHDRFFEAAAVMKGKKYQSIVANKEAILLNYELIDLTKEHFTQEEVAKAIEIAKAPKQFDVRAVKNLFVALEFYSLIEDFASWITRFQTLK